MAVLLEPSGGIFAPGAVVVLRGSATDLEDGSIPEEKLTWSSDVQGELGKGYEVAINNLTPGSHTLTLTAVDSQGISGSASVNVTIGLGIYLPAVTR
jgi:chitinase